MKKTILAGAALLVVNLLTAQQKEGKVVYERTIQMQIQIADNDQVAHMLPKTRTDKFELNFANNKSLWKHAEEEIENNDISGNGMQIKVMTPGQDDIVFNDFDASRKTEQRSMFDKKFIIEDSIKKLNWKITGETKTIAGHLCQQATAQRVSMSMRMNINNGVMERKEVTDTSNIVAWFTTDIPVPAGPEFQGQLPGLVLALDINNGKMVYVATEVKEKADIASIKAPTKGEKVTLEEFRKKTAKMMEEMQQNQGPGGQHIQIRQ